MPGRRGGGRRGRGGRGSGRGGSGGRGGRGGRASGGRAASGNPSTYKPTVPHKLGKELGLGGGGGVGGRPRSADDDDDGAAGDNAFGGSNGAYAVRGDEAEGNDEEHAGPGNRTGGWVAGGGTRAQGGGGLYGLSKRKAERKAARLARKQQPTLAQLRATWNKQQAEPAKGAKQSRKGPAGTASGSSAAGRGPAAAGAGRKRKAEVPNGSQGRDTTAKQQRRAVPQRPSTARSSKFEELLGDLNPTSGRIVEAELQRRLAKKLGLKSLRAGLGGDDGLDDLLDGLDDGLDSADSSGEDSDAAADDGDDGGGFGSGDGSSDSDEAGDDGVDAEVSGDSSSGREDGSGGDSEFHLDSESDEAVTEDVKLASGRHMGNGTAHGATSEAAAAAGVDMGGSEADFDGLDSEDRSSGDESCEPFEDDDDDGVMNAAAAERRQSSAAATASGRPGMTGAYVPPALRAKADAATDADADRLLRRVRGLLNRLAESNLQRVASDVVALFPSEGRRTVCRAVSDELLAAVVGGPRATELFSAVTAAAVAGVAALARATEVVAEFAAALAAALETAHERADSLAAHNLTRVAAHLCTAGAVDAGLLFSLLGFLTARFAETDVAMMLTLLRAAGFRLRGADPVAMKAFVLAVHARAAQAAAAGEMTARAEVMLGLVTDIKNNKRRPGNKGADAAPAVLPAAVQSWLKASGVGEVELRNVTWTKLLSSDKRGLWWLPTAEDAAARSGGAAVSALPGGEGGAELLRLAAGQRMNTDARRAVFCAVMGAEDCMDAFERLLKLQLKGEQERELVRVTLECCLQEASWNPYYAHLALKLAAAAKSHRFTLQYCLWDQFKAVDEAQPRRASNLARFVATVIANFGLSLSILKPLDFRKAMSARKQLFWNSTLEQLLLACRDEATVTAVFSRLAGVPALQGLAASLEHYMRRLFAPWLQRRAQETIEAPVDAEALQQRLRTALMALHAASTAVLAG